MERRTQLFGRMSGYIAGVLCVLAAGFPAQSWAQSGVRINVGGATFQDVAARNWEADRNSTGGAVVTGATDIGPSVANTSIQAPFQSLYKSQRTGATFSYSLPITNGTYVLNLYFAELQNKAVGERKFDVSAEGTSVLTDFDIAKEATGANKAFVKTFRVTVTDGKLDLAFTGKVGEAAVNGIEAAIPFGFRPTIPGVQLVDTALPGWAYDAQPRDDGASGGDSVNLATGAYENCLGTDVGAKNFYGPDAQFVRVYNTARAAQGVSSPGLPRGWTHNFDLKVYTVNAGTTWNPLAIVYPTGAVEQWLPKDGTNCLETAQGTQYVVSGTRGANPDEWTSLKVKFRDEVTWEFTPRPGQAKTYILSAIYNRIGRKITIERDADERPTAVKHDNAGGAAILSFGYTSNLVTSVVDEVKSRQVNYVYGQAAGENCLLSVTRDVAKGTATGPTAIQYGYVAVTGKPYLNSIGVETFTLKSTALTVTHTVEYDAATGKVTKVNSPRGDSKTYAYNAGNTVVNTVDKTRGPISTYTQNFDPNAFLIDKGTKDAANNSESTIYGDDRHPLLPTALTTKNGQRIDYTYDEFGNVLTESVPSNGKRLLTAYRYDYATDPLCGAGWGRLLEVKVGNQTSTLYEYYPNGMVKAIETPAPGTVGTGARVRTEYTYTALGNIATIKTPAQNDEAGVVTTTYKYTDDATAPAVAGAAERLEKPLAVEISDAAGVVKQRISYRYDAAGQLVKMIDGTGNVTDYTFTPGGRVKTMVAGGVTTTYTYDGTDGPVKQVDIAKAGKPTRTIVTKTESTDAANKRNVTTDAFGRIRQMKDGAGAVMASADYDNVGNLTSISKASAGAPVTVTFDPAGNIKTRTDAKGTTTYTYAPDDDRLLSVTYSGGTTPGVSYQYDDYGRVTQMTDGSGVTKYAYDDLDNLLSVTTQYTGLPARKVSYTYNKDGSRKTMSLGDDAAIGTLVKNLAGTQVAGTFTYNYDALGNVTRVIMPWVGTSFTYAYDANGRLTQQKGVKAQTDYTYDARGMLTKLSNVSRFVGTPASVDEGGVQQITEPNPYSPLPLANIALPPTSPTVTVPTGNVTRQKSAGDKTFSVFQNMEYDAAGNRTKMDVLLPAQGWSPNGGGSIMFEYDTNDRLTKEKRTFTEPRFSKYNYEYDYLYDSMGQLIELGNVGYRKKLERDALRRVKSKPGGIEYGTDGRVSKKGDNTITTDAAGRMLTYGAALTNTWRGDGLRASKQGTQKAFFLYDGDKVVAELDQAGAVKTLYAYGPMGLIHRHNNATGNYLEFTFDPHGNRVQSHRQADSTTLAANTTLYTMMGTPFFLSSALSGGPMPIIDPVGAFGQSGQYSDEETRTAQDPAGIALLGQNLRIAELDGTSGRWINSPSPMLAMEIADQMPYYGMLNVGRGVLNSMMQDLQPVIEAGAYGASTLEWMSRQMDPTVPFVEDDTLANQLARTELALPQFEYLTKKALDLHYDQGYEWYGKLGETAHAVGSFATGALNTGASITRMYSMSASRGCTRALLGQCFIAGTPVWMADGTVKSIEEIKAGDLVLSLNLTTNKLESKQVVKTFVREAEYLHSLTIGSETLYTTAGHPFLTEKGYVDAEELGVGTSLVTRAGPGSSASSSLSSLVGASPTWGGASVSGNLRYNPEQVFFGQRGTSGYTVYNFEVEDNHNYFVGKTNGGICVHNATYGRSSPFNQNTYSGHGQSVRRGFPRTGHNTQSHHVIQNEWARHNIPGYSEGAAPAILLETGATPLRPHTVISRNQNARRDARLALPGGTANRWNTTIREEFDNSSRDLRAGLQNAVNSGQLSARAAVKIRKRALSRAYKHFDELGAF
jgi:YD repeat-containing protein